MPPRCIDGKWWIDFRYGGKRYRHRPPLNTRRAAVDEERRQIDRLSHGLPIGRDEERDDSETCAAYLDRWVATYVVNNKPSEAATKKRIVANHLVPFFGAETLTSTNWARRLDEFKAHQTQGKKLSAKTINNQLTVLGRALATAVEWGLLPAAPKIQWLKTAKPAFDFLTANEAAMLLAAAHQRAKYHPLTIGHEQASVMVLTALRAGLRRGELLALRWSDLDFINAKIVVRQSDSDGIITTPKSGREREVPMSPELSAALRGHRHLRGPYVFCREDGTRLNRGVIAYVVPGACRRAGLRELQWHALRHTFASQLVMNGTPIKVVQELLGHATIEMTMRYAHVSPSMHAAAVAGLDGAGNLGQQVGSKSSVNVLTLPSTRKHRQ